MLLYNVQLLCYYVTLSLKSYSVSRRYFCYSVTLSQMVTLSLRRYFCYSVTLSLKSYSVSKAVQRYVFSTTFQSKKPKNCTKGRKTCAFSPFCAMFACRAAE